MPLDVSLIDLWATWLATDAPRRLTQATMTEYRRQLLAFADWLEATLGIALRADQITPYRMEQYLAAIEAQIRRKERRHATYNKAVAVLSSFGTWLVEAGYCTATPARRLRTLPEQLGPAKTLDRLTVVKMLDAAHHTGDLRDAFVIELLVFSGMRAQEVASLQLEDLEMGRRTTWLSVAGKRQKQRRVPLPKRVGDVIRTYLHERTQREQVQPTSGPLLVGERGGITRATINRIVRKVATRAYLSVAERQLVTPHAFRHTVATRVARTHDLVIAADLLGHSSLTTTRRYAKASMQELEVAIEGLYDA